MIWTLGCRPWLVMQTGVASTLFGAAPSIRPPEQSWHNYDIYTHIYAYNNKHDNNNNHNNHNNDTTTNNNNIMIIVIIIITIYIYIYIYMHIHIHMYMPVPPEIARDRLLCHTLRDVWPRSEPIGYNCIQTYILGML